LPFWTLAQTFVSVTLPCSPPRPSPRATPRKISPPNFSPNSEFASGIDIRQFLARLLTLVTKGRISPRRASVLAFITSQLLHSHRAITLESAPPKEETQIIINIPRPDRDWPDAKPRPENPTYADLRS
jgi:hypothetical protein